MLQNIKLNNVFVIDIETVPQKEKFEELPPHLQELWEQKSRYQRKEETAAEFYDRAGIWAEFELAHNSVRKQRSNCSKIPNIHTPKDC